MQPSSIKNKSDYYNTASDLKRTLFSQHFMYCVRDLNLFHLHGQRKDIKTKVGAY